MASKFQLPQSSDYTASYPSSTERICIHCQGAPPSPPYPLVPSELLLQCASLLFLIIFKHNRLHIATERPFVRLSPRFSSTTDINPTGEPSPVSGINKMTISRTTI